MAHRRMFSAKVIDTDVFLDLPASSQALYFHLAMRADDDGFVASPRKIMKISNSSDDDYKLLMAKRFVIPFESGICVIRHWRIHNYIQSDRYQPTIYNVEKELLTIENGHYEPSDTKCIQDVSKMDTQVRLGKVRLKKRETRSTTLHPVFGVPINQTRYDNLVTTYGKSVVDRYIQRAIDYVNSDRPNKPYADYASTAGRWIDRDGVQSPDNELNLYKRKS